MLSNGILKLIAQYYVFEITSDLGRITLVNHAIRLNNNCTSCAQNALGPLRTAEERKELL